MDIYTNDEHGAISYDQIIDLREEIVSEYGDEPHELLVADCSYEHVQMLETIAEVESSYSTDSIFIPVDNLDEWIEDKAKSILQPILDKIEMGEWPYADIKVKLDKIIEQAREELAPEEIYIDGESYMVVADIF